LGLESQFLGVFLFVKHFFIGSLSNRSSIRYGWYSQKVVTPGQFANNSPHPRRSTQFVKTGGPARIADHSGGLAFPMEEVV